MMKISVIIPTFNRGETLKKALVSLERQSVPKENFEVLIIDDGSFDNILTETSELIKKVNINTTLLVQKHSGPAKARNLGIQNAKYEIVLIINDDTICTNDLLSEHLNFHQKYHQIEAGVLGYVTWSPDIEITPFMRWLERRGPQFSYHKIKGEKAYWYQLWTCNISFKKSFLLENKLFDEDFPYAAWEDVELGYRLYKKGLRLYYNKKAVGFHYHYTDLDSMKNKMKIHGKSALIIKRKVPKKYCPPLVLFPYYQIFSIIDKILFIKPFSLFWEFLAKFTEKRYAWGGFYILLLIHYKLLGIKENL